MKIILEIFQQDAQDISTWSKIFFRCTVFLRGLPEKNYEEHFPKVVKYVLTTQKELLQKSTSFYMPFTTNIGKGKVDYYPACVSFQLLIHYFGTLGKEIFQV